MLAERGRKLTILVVRLAAMGDILRTLPAVRLVRGGLPDARIHWAVDDRWRRVIEGHPDLDGLVSFPRQEWNARSLRRFRSELRALEPALVLDFHGTLRSGMTGWLSGAPVRLGYAGHQQKELNRWLNTHHCASGSRRTPRMERNLDLVRALGLPDRPLPGGDLPLAAAGREAAERLLAETIGPGRAFAVVSPGASRAQIYKRLPTRLASAACRRLTQHRITPLVVWGPGEEDDAAAVANQAATGAILAPRTDLPTLAALLAAARLFVGGDSGPLHMACAVGCPVVAIFGSTDPSVNSPWGVPFRTVFPSDRQYTGIKRLDRAAGGFEGISALDIDAAVDELVVTPQTVFE